jgi:hypothetical protein
MADAKVDITAGSGTGIDTRTEATNGNHRAVIVIGDPSTNAGVAPVDATAGLKVDLGADNDVVLGAGTNGIGKLTANDGVDIGDVTINNASGAAAVNIQDGGNSITIDGSVAVSSVTPGTNNTSLGKAEDAAHASGDVGVMSLGVRAAAPTDRSAGPTDGDYEPYAVNEVGAVWETPTPSANGGLTIFRSIDLDETEEEVKATAGNVYGMWVTNTATATRFIKFYNATAANVTVGTTTPVITWGIPGNSTDDISGLFGSAMGIGFSTAITVAATTGVADNDTGAPGANEVIVNIFYK